MKFAVLVAIALGICLPRPAAATEVKVDRRVQVVTTVYWLASKGKAFQGPVDPSYARQTKYYFHKFSGHPAFKYARALDSAGFDSQLAVSWILTYSRLPELEAGPGSGSIEVEGVTRDDLMTFADSLRDFAVDTNFDSFLEQQSMRLTGFAAQARSAAGDEATAAILGDAQLLVAPLVGSLCRRVDVDSQHYVVLNPTAYATIPAIRRAIAADRCRRRSQP